MGTHICNVLHGIGPVRVTAQLYPLPGSEVLGDLFPFFQDGGFQLFQGRRIIDPGIFLRQFFGVIYLLIDILDGILKIKELPIWVLGHRVQLRR